MDTSDFVTALHGTSYSTFLPGDICSPASTLHFSVRVCLLVDGGLGERPALVFTDKTSALLGLSSFAVHLFPSAQFFLSVLSSPLLLFHAFLFLCSPAPLPVGLLKLLSLSSCSFPAAQMSPTQAWGVSASLPVSFVFFSV